MLINLPEDEGHAGLGGLWTGVQAIQQLYGRGQVPTREEREGVRREGGEERGVRREGGKREGVREEVREEGWCGGKTVREWTWGVFKRRYSDMKERNEKGYDTK